MTAVPQATSTRPPAPTPPPSRSTGGRWLRRLAWLLLVLLAVTGAAWWGLPALLVSQLPPKLSQVLGRPVTLQGAAFVPWRLALTLTGLRIGAAPGAPAGTPPLLQMDSLLADVSLRSLQHRAPVLEALEINGLQMQVARTADGHYDIDDLLARFAQPADAKPADDKPARFALYNLALRNASLRLDDKPVGKVHTLDALTLTLPFLSNLPADIGVRTEPRLAFTVNGTRVDSGSQALPFAQTRSGELTLAFKDLDLRPALPYLPAGLPLRLQQARLGTDIQLRFALPPSGVPSVALQGKLALRDVVLTEPDNSHLLRWQTLALDLADVQPLARQVALGALQIDGLQLEVSRDAQGRLNLQRLLAPQAAAAPASKPGTSLATSAASGAATSPASASKPAEPTAAWQLSLAALRLPDARVRWSDAAVKPAVALQLDALSLQAEQLRWPSPAAVPVVLQGQLRGQQDGAPTLATLQVDGQANDQQAALALQLSGLDLASLAPYLAQTLNPKLSGQLALQAKLNWAAAPATLHLALSSLSLKDLQLRDSSGTGARATRLAAVQALQLKDTLVDLVTHQVSIGNLQIDKPALAVSRDAQGRLNLASWAVAAAPPTASASASVSASAIASAIASAAASAPASNKPVPPTTPWRLNLQDLAINGGQLQWTDALAANPDSGAPLRLDLSALRVRLQGLGWPAATGSKAALPRLQLAAKLSSPAGSGELADKDHAKTTADIHWTGRFGLAPLQAEGKLTLVRLPVHLLARYAGSAMPVSLLHADASFQGQLQARQADAGWQVATDGDLQVTELQLNSRAAAGQRADSGSELLTWQSLALQGLAVVLAPAAKPSITVREIGLDDFYARLTITEDGRFNLQDVAAKPADAASGVVSTAASGAALAVAVAVAPTAAASTPASAAANAPANTDLPITLVLGPSQLRNGRIDFSDRFIRPNYSVRLTELTGQLGALRSDTRDMASISLRGRAAQTALIDISGQVNPTARPLALDIRAKATDLELAPLSPYAGKYAGYAIERGKLSMAVAYTIDPDGKLVASNQVTLNQLTFGERVESPSATQLPVLLAVALLKDRNGVIDINLPISGSVSDPQFSIGGLVWKVILNLLGRALTAPFALLAGGGADDLSLVEFAPGTARVSETGQQALSKVATALTDRPALKMTVTGAADPAAERPALQRAALDERLLAEHNRERLRAAPAGAAAAASGAASAASAASTNAASAANAAAAPPPAQLSADEHMRLLKTLYQQTSLPNKPRNAVGQLRDLPSAEMEAMLLAAVPVTDDSARELALQRGLAVRDALIARGLPSERLFLAAPKLRAAGEGDAAWTPRVQLTLSTQ